MGFLTDTLFGKKEETQRSSSLRDLRTEQNQSSFGYGAETVRGGSSGTSSVAFEDILRSLYSNAGGAAGSAAALIPQLQGRSDQLFGRSGEFLDQLQGGGAADDYLTGRLGDTSVLTSQLDELDRRLGKFYSDELLPGITSRAVGSGQLGGGRQGVAQGRAVGEVSDAYASGASNLIASDQASRDEVAKSYLAQRGANASTGLNALPSIYGVQEASANAALTPVSALAQIIGSPTVLQQSSSFNAGDSFDINRMINELLTTDHSESSGVSYGRTGGLNALASTASNFFQPIKLGGGGTSSVPGIG